MKPWLARRTWRAQIRALVPRIRQLRAIEREYPGHQFMPGYDSDWVRDPAGHAVPMRRYDIFCWALLLKGIERKRAHRTHRELCRRYGVGPR